MTQKILLLLLPLLFFWGCDSTTDSDTGFLEFVDQESSIEIKQDNTDSLTVLLRSSEVILDSSINFSVTDKDGAIVSSDLITYRNDLTKDDTYFIKSILTVSSQCPVGVYKLHYNIISGSYEDTLIAELVVKGEDFVQLNCSVTEKKILKGNSDSLVFSVKAAGKVTHDSISYKILESSGAVVSNNSITISNNDFNSMDTSFVTSITVNSSAAVDTFTVITYAKYADLLDSASFTIIVTATEPFKYVALGASDAVGVGADPITTGYVYVINDSLKTIKDEVELTNLGVSGYVAEEIHHEQVSLAINAQPDLVTIWVGGNDLRNLIINGSSDVTPFTMQVDSIFSKLTVGLPNAKIVAANMPDFSKLPILAMASPEEKQAANQITQLVNGVLAQKATEYDIELVDLYTADYIADPTTVCDDGFHPSTKGYKFIADSYFTTIKEIVE